MPIKSVFIVGTDNGVMKLFKSRGLEVAETEEDADAVVFTGGSDIYPYIYGERPMPGGFYNHKRDLQEIRVFKTLAPSKPKIGICRGAQLLNVLCGGTLFQDVDGHQGKDCQHEVKDFVSGRIIILNSVHHQMMIPGDNAFVIACARAATYKHGPYQKISYRDSALVRDWDDHEVLYYQNFNSLCYQAHPELDTEEAKAYFFELVNTYLNNAT